MSEKFLDRFMGNELAMRLGEVGVALAEYPRHLIGDNIDRGLVLRRLLEEAGFRLVCADSAEEPTS